MSTESLNPEDAVVPQPASTQDKQETTTQSGSHDIIYLLVFGGAIFYAVAWKFSEKDSLWVQLLFSLPVFAQLIGGAFHIPRARRHGDRNQFFYNFSMVISTACIAVYCILWILFSASGLRAYRVFSWIALLAVAILIGLVLYMMCAFMKEPDGKRWPSLSHLRTGAADEPLWALSFLFFVIFLDVAFLFGFAFAFHDQHCLEMSKTAGRETPALRMLNLDVPDEPEAAAGTSAATNGGKQAEPADARPGSQADSKAPAATSGEAAPYFFYFVSYKARLDTNPPDELKNWAKEKCKAAQSAGEPVELEDWVDSNPKAFNYCSLERIKKRIELEASEGKRTRIVLLGRSDNQAITGQRGRSSDSFDYKSNYELSEARVQGVKYKIIEGLKEQDEPNAWRNLEWLTLPSSNEGDEDSDKTDKKLKDILTNKNNYTQQRKKEIEEQNKRIVIASVAPIPGDITSLQMKQLSRQQFKQLTLMDYMYFSIYTITTTGYGDIIPTTGYSKFVISIANICEVLFLVVFFNALVSIRKDNRR